VTNGIPHLLLIGAAGQVGWELERTLQPLGSVLATRRAELDLTDPDAVRARVLECRPALICNAAAYTAVDRAESEPDAAQRVNAVAPGVLGEAARACGAAVVHFSTDYVFAGTAAVPYRETDRPEPLSVYGRTKLAGERALADSGVAHLVVRTSWVFAARGHNFVRTMLRLAREREELRVIADQTGSPTWARWLAEATAQIAGWALRHPGGTAAALRDRGGVLHLAGGGSTSWHGFAEAILAADCGRTQHRARRVVPIRSAEFPTAARRPAYSVLDCSEAARRFGIVAPPWQRQLELLMAELGAAGGA
jgi:dTDP-4-dehydrorhamnose reductase